MTDTTPAPPTDTADLNVQIATLRGWTDAVTVDPEGNEWNIVRNQDTDEEEYDWSALPNYASDPAAAFELLDHALTIRQVFKHEISKGLPDGPHRYCRIYTAFGTFVGCADTLPLAIALACRDALSSLQGDTDNGTD